MVVVVDAANMQPFVLPISNFMEDRLRAIFSYLPAGEFEQMVNEFLKYIYLSSVNIGRGKVNIDKIGGSFIPVKKVIDFLNYLSIHS